MKLVSSIKNYFAITAIESWNYGLFSIFMKIIGYDNNEDCIIRIYVRFFKDFIKENDLDDYEKEIIIVYLKIIGITLEEVSLDNEINIIKKINDDLNDELYIAFLIGLSIC